MCDTLCALTPAGTVFAKNSDRPPQELQLPEVHGPWAAGGRLRTQYLEIDDTGAAPVLLSRPDWLWGAEHGVNAHGVAIGNEKVDTRSGAAHAAPALLGMDLVRLGLERARTADGALDVVTELLERHGQGGTGDRVHGVAYDSSFLLADASAAWVLETAGRTWAAQPVPPGGAAAISNRLSIRRGWTRASADVGAGTDVDTWRDPDVDPAYADGRLAAGRAFLGCGTEVVSAAHGEVTARRMVAHLRDHGRGPWGEPGRGVRGDGSPPSPPPRRDAGLAGITVCMHVRGLMATTASMVALLPPPEGGPRRTWLAAGSPCTSVYVPMLGSPDPSTITATASLWRAGAALSRRVEEHADELAAVRAVLDPLEDELWDEADDLVDQPTGWARFARQAWARVAETAGRLSGVTAPGRPLENRVLPPRGR